MLSNTGESTRIPDQQQGPESEVYHAGDRHARGDVHDSQHWNQAHIPKQPARMTGVHYEGLQISLVPALASPQPVQSVGVGFFFSVRLKDQRAIARCGRTGFLGLHLL